MQYIIELGANGMEAMSSSLPHIDLLQKLRDRLKAWNSWTVKDSKLYPSETLVFFYFIFLNYYSGEAQETYTFTIAYPITKPERFYKYICLLSLWSW